MGTTSWPLSDDQNEISHSDLKDRKEGEDPVANYTFPPPTPETTTFLNTFNHHKRTIVIPLSPFREGGRKWVIKSLLICPA